MDIVFHLSLQARYFGFQQADVELCSLVDLGLVYLVLNFLDFLRYAQICLPTPF